MVTLQLSKVKDAIEVLSLYMFEQISHPTRCIAVTPFFKEAASLVGSLAKFKLEIDSGKEEWFRGYIVRVGLETETVELETLSWAALLSRSASSRIFEQQSLSQIIKTVLEKCPVKYSINDVEMSLDLSIQFNETDFNYLNRLLEHNGVFYFFREIAEKTEWVFSQNNAAFTENKVALPQIERLKKNLSWLPGKYNLKGLQNNRVVHELDSGDTDFIINDEISQPAESDVIAKVRQRELALGIAEIEGESVCEHIRTGRKITLNKAAVLVTKVEHQWVLGEGYSNVFHGVPSDIEVVPPRETAIPDVSGVYMAQVIGASEGIADLDEQGKVRIDFEWADSEKSQCWAPVTQVWSGKYNAIQFFPRVGDKVFVCFENSDPDRPIVVGSVSETKTPLIEGNKKVTTGILTKSPNSKKHGWIVTEEKDNETLTIIADNAMTVEAEKRTVLIKSHDKTTIKEGDMTVEIEQGNIQITANKGTITLKGKDIAIEAQDTISLKNGTVSLVLTKNGTLEVE